MSEPAERIAAMGAEQLAGAWFAARIGLVHPDDRAAIMERQKALGLSDRDMAARCKLGAV